MTAWSDSIRPGTPVIETLTGPRLARALRAGALAVVQQQEQLNRINVFPVPDADTGSNLAATVRAAAAALVMPHFITVGQTARVAADAALDGARGNSGAIFAQFLHGMAEAIGSSVQVTTRDFAAAVRAGVEAAHEALQKPVEGTILSVLAAWSSALDQQVRQAPDFGTLLGRALEQARVALANTPRQLAVLARHGVVDAGAQGLVYFLEGISDFLKDRRAADWRRSGLSADTKEPFAAAHAETDLSHRYCSEGLVSGRRLDRKAIGAAVAHLGESLVVAGGGSRVRVHLHTNHPQTLFDTLSAHGTLVATKIDDMVIQQLAVRDASIAVVTDSGCDLPDTVANRLAVVKVPLTLTFGDERFTDGVDISPAQFYQRLAGSTGPARTSQPAVGDFRAVYRELLAHHAAVISVHLSSSLSGTFQAAQAAARMEDASRIHVVDSRGVSVAMGLVVEAVGEAVAAGATVDEALRVAAATVPDVRLWATFPSLVTAVRGGRVSPSVARFANVFGLKPIIVLDDEGRASRGGMGLGFAGSLRTIARKVARFAGAGQTRLLIAHANAIGAAEYLAEELASRIPLGDVPLVNLAPVLAAHTGPGAVGIAALRPRS